jgi:TolB-like protein/Flp pilus assembly protein TadD
MPDLTKEIELEIAHVLFLDMVGYSKLSVNEQHARVNELNQIIRASEQFQKAETANRILKIPTGDGMALVFYKSPEEPAQCAVEISRALKTHPNLPVRMGVHSGPVSGIVDVNQRSNVAGAGINVAQRVMDCGDAGHILLSRHVAEDLAEFERWRLFLHDLGTFAVKHGARVDLTNFYSDEVGNPQLPSKLENVRKRRTRRRWAAAALGLLLLGTSIAWLGGFLPNRTPTAAAALEKSIAVLPFENLSRDPDNAFFTDGVQDEILTHLARIADLKVISRTSVTQYKTGVARNLRRIGQELGVAHVVEGSVQRAANKVRVNAQLVDTQTDAHLWAETYDRELADVFAIQTEIAKTIAQQLQARLSPQEKAALGIRPTEDTEAYDSYLRAKQLMYSTSSEEVAAVGIYPRAIALLENAVARDPKFASAYCLLGQAELSLYWQSGGSAGDRRDRAAAALQSARRLAPEAAELYLTEALFSYWADRDYEAALSSLRQAARFLPNNVDVFRYSALIERRSGHWQECIRHQLDAVEIDPLNWRPRNELMSSYQLVHDYIAAEKAAALGISACPERADYFRAKKAEMALYRGDREAARNALATLSVPDPLAMQLFYCALLERNYEEAHRVLNVWTQRHEPEYPTYPWSFFEGMAARAAGQSDKARRAFEAARQHFTRLLTDRKEPVLLSQLGIVDAALGRNEEAVSEARQAVELLPISRDAVMGPDLVRNLALVYCWTGEKDLANQQLEAIAKLPSNLSYGELKLDPAWDALRGDPRFEKIVESLAPK